MPYKLVVLHTGYVESGSLGQVAFKYRPFDHDLLLEDSPLEALNNLATDLFVKWWWDTYTTYRDYKTKEAKWDKIHFESFEYDMRHMVSDTADSFGCQELINWWPWCDWAELQSVPLGQTINIYEKAEELIPLFVDFGTVDYNNRRSPSPEDENWTKVKQLYFEWIRKKDLYWNGREGMTKLSLEEYREKLFWSSCKTYDGSRPKWNG